MEIEAGQTGAHFRGGTAIKLLKHLALATLAVASLLAGTGTQHAAADPPAPAVTAIQPISGGAEGIDFIDNSVEGQPVVPVSPPDPTVDYGACAICNVPPYLQPGPQTLVFRPAATAVFGHIHRELAPLETDCLDALPYPTMGLEVGFYNYAGEGALFGCNLNIIWQAGFRFDLSMLRQARATGRWFPTDAVLTFKETPYPDAKDDPAHGGHWQNGEGDELPTQTCWLRLARIIHG